jgi:hypothetical protein
MVEAEGLAALRLLIGMIGREGGRWLSLRITEMGRAADS